MKSLEEFQIIIIIVYLVILIAALIVALSIYNEYADSKKDENVDSGNWHGGTFYASPEIVIPIDDKTENQALQKIINRHKKAAIFFWIWLLMLVPIIIFNSVD
jgi:sensor histidine kinase regulating citrate/malate metabolism